jgi:hypothetical protein
MSEAINGVLDRGLVEFLAVEVDTAVAVHLEIDEPGRHPQISRGVRNRFYGAN